MRQGPDLEEMGGTRIDRVDKPPKSYFEHFLEEIKEQFRSQRKWSYAIEIIMNNEIWTWREKELGRSSTIGIRNGVEYLMGITRSIALQHVRGLYYGQEIGLLDDISCHLALIPSGYQSHSEPTRKGSNSARTTYVFKPEVYMHLCL